MGLTLEQMSNVQEIAKQFIKESDLKTEQRVQILIQALYDVIMNKSTNPITLLTENSGKLQDTPVGSILPFIGTIPPEHYLACDGTIYNISDYPVLANLFLTQFESYNYFGGDGEVTFAVPDLRNEFIRGFHMNKEQKLSGAIGKHQDPTQYLTMFSGNSNELWYDSVEGGTSRPIAPDISYQKAESTRSSITPTKKMDETYEHTVLNKQHYTSPRPTNVAVLFCIKCEPTYYINVEPSFQHYENTVNKDVVIGTYGSKKLYRRLLYQSQTITSGVGDYKIYVGDLDISLILKGYGWLSNDDFIAPITCSDPNDGIELGWYYDKKTKYIHILVDSFYQGKDVSPYFYIEYIKIKDLL